MKTEYSLGLRKSPRDNRDFLMMSLLDTKTLPDRHDLTAEMTPVRSQGNEGACVGFATAVGIKEYMEQIDYDKFIQLSPRFIYEKAKEISGHSEGTTLKAAMQVAKTLGICEERYWPYIPQSPGVPYCETYDNALKYRVKSYARVTNLWELKQSLVQFGPILAGIKVFKSIYKTSNDGIVSMPGWFSRAIGGHAIAICGYNEKKQLVKFKNSWGDWGQQGYGYLSYEYIDKNMLDAFSMVDIEDPSPYVRTVGSLTKEQRKEAWV